MHGTVVVSFNATDVFDSATGKWSTAELSVARAISAAVSVGRFAIFAGGQIGWAFLAEHDLGACALIFVAAGTDFVFNVDLFDSATGLWSTYYLSYSYGGVRCASVGVFALFVGLRGIGMSCLLRLRSQSLTSPRRYFS
jgi:hypothetical protein